MSLRVASVSPLQYYPISFHLPRRKPPHSLSTHRHPPFSLIISSPLTISAHRKVPSLPPYTPLALPFKLTRSLLHLSASSLLLLFIGFFSLSTFGPAKAYAASGFPVTQQERVEDKDLDRRDIEKLEDKELSEEFEKWKSKTFALTVPLRIVSLGGSVPPSWIKDFVQSQGKRLKFSMEVRYSLERIYSELVVPLNKGNTPSRSAMAADLITVGSSWLSLAISNAVIEPMQLAEEHDWFRALSDKWKIFLLRNSEGKMDRDGKIWAVPYRWGSMVIAYKKSKLEKHGLAPIEDWADLWCHKLAGRIAMVDCPREVVGAVLKYMGASYNTTNINKEIPGGINSVMQNLAMLANQVRLFDSVHYLKAFGVGDVWVAVGWSSDVLPVAKRMSDVAVIVPKSGASLWADLLAVPSTARCTASELGGRTRGPSPLIYQWLEFCLQPARQLRFKQGVFPGSSPSTLEDLSSEVLKEDSVGAPELNTNLISGVPPPEILSKCEFLEPLSEAALSDYKTLISSINRPGHGFVQKMQNVASTVVHTAWGKVFPGQN